MGLNRSNETLKCLPEGHVRCMRTTNKPPILVILVRRETREFVNRTQDYQRHRNVFDEERADVVELWLQSVTYTQQTAAVGQFPVWPASALLPHHSLSVHRWLCLTFLLSQKVHWNLCSIGWNLKLARLWSSSSSRQPLMPWIDGAFFW